MHKSKTRPATSSWWTLTGGPTPFLGTQARLRPSTVANCVVAAVRTLGARRLTRVGRRLREWLSATGPWRRWRQWKHGANGGSVLRSQWPKGAFEVRAGATAALLTHRSYYAARMEDGLVDRIER